MRMILILILLLVLALYTVSNGSLESTLESGWRVLKGLVRDVFNKVSASLHGYETLPPIPPEETYNETPNEWQRLALEYLNRVREREGVPPVRWIPLKTPQYRVEYMLKTGIFSHYDADGRHPIYYYTKLDGGKYAAEENGAMVKCPPTNKTVICYVNMTDFIVGSIRWMVYNDSHADWGHRRSLLDPCNNYVSVGIVYNGSEAHMTIYMVSRWVRWIKPPTYDGMRFTAEGYVNDTIGPNSYFNYYVRIFYDVPNKSYVKRLHYELGEIIAEFNVVPRGRNGTFWFLKVDIPFKPQKPGLYTFVIYGFDSRRIVWEPKPGVGRSNEGALCPLATYTVEVG